MEEPHISTEINHIKERENTITAKPTHSWSPAQKLLSSESYTEKTGTASWRMKKQAKDRDKDEIPKFQGLRGSEWKIICILT